MPRIRLPNRRQSITQKIFVAMDGGKELKLLLTIGFDSDNKPKEVFCAGFRAGTALETIVMDACILMSRLLQYGNTPQELYKTMAQPPSVLGAIAKAIAELG